MHIISKGMKVVSLKDRIFSLVLVFLMLVAAAITVNKSVFGKSLQDKPVAEESSDSPGDVNDDHVNVLADGTVVINTSKLPKTVTGYAGPVPLEIYVKDGKISDIKPLQNDETPSFFKRAIVLVESWIGKTPQEALALNVDAVSGATYTSNAIISNVDAGMAYYDGVANKPKSNTPIKIWIALAVALSACIFPLFVKNKFYHNVQMIANIIVLGFWCGQFLDYSLILKYISSGFILPAGLVAVVMLTAAFIYPLFGRPQHYCNHICPLGAAQQLVAEICGYKVHIPKKVLTGLDWFRKILWAALMLLLWTDCMTGWMDLELFQAFQFKSASAWIIVAACSFVALSAVIARPYCRFVCPTGSLFKVGEDF